MEKVQRIIAAAKALVVNTVLPKTQCALDVFVRKDHPWWQRVIDLFAIKLMYIALTVALLSGKWYVGHGSYDIVFCWWKELIASAVFFGVSSAYVRLDFGKGLLSATTHLLFLFYYIPLNSAFAVNDASFGFFLMSNGYFVVLLAALYAANRFNVRTTTPSARLLSPKPLYSGRLIRLFCAALCVLFILHKLSYNGLSLSLSFQSEDVYGNRSEYTEYLQSISGTVWSYLLSILRNLAPTVLPFYILISLQRKKVLPLVLSGLCMLAAFSVSSEKSKLLMPMVAVGIFILHKLNVTSHFKRVSEVGVLCLLSACSLLAIVGANGLYTLLVRREMYMPAWLNTLYYDYFSQHAKVFWSQDVFLLDNLIPSSYEISPLYVISNEYFAGLVPSPNTGMFADAYLQFGAIGALIIYPVLLAALIGFAERAVEPYGKAVSALISFQLVLKLNNVPLLRTDMVLSSITFLVFLWILPRLETWDIRSLKQRIWRK